MVYLHGDIEIRTSNQGLEEIITDLHRYIFAHG
jgi:hypothetical protein